ncbi:MAG TPA: TRAP transporter substrate-binding protein [Candidatus Acidoferrales bacterium]|nr:TRAP transporter substrate-binding protein [Candidatus Acidoferrales bacterium]
MSALISRRKFSAGLIAAGGSMLLGRGVRAAEFQLRQFHNQPADSPLHKRLVQMWTAVKEQTGGRVEVQTFAENDHLPGGDPGAFKMIINGELDFFTLNGGVIGTVVPAMNVQSIPFAFRTHTQVYAALDGDLGNYLCDEMSAKGIYGVRRGCFANGFHQLTCATKPIRTADDLRGLKMRTPDAEIYVECWKTLGAVPVVTNLDKAYAALKSGAAEAQSDPLSIVEALKLYEVQKYVSMTNHMWTGFNLIANLKMWQRLPADAQRIIERNVAKYVPLQRADNDALNAGLRSRLTQQGMIFNEAQASTFRDRLGPFYSHWKKTIGQQAWSLLEKHVGKLG